MGEVTRRRWPRHYTRVLVLLALAWPFALTREKLRRELSDVDSRKFAAALRWLRYYGVIDYEPTHPLTYIWVDGTVAQALDVLVPRPLWPDFLEDLENL